MTTLKGERQALAPKRILEVKSVPDTLIVLSDGGCLMVRESLEEVLRLFTEDCKTGIPFLLKESMK